MSTTLRAWQVGVSGPAYVDWTAEDGSLIRSVVVLIAPDSDAINVGSVAPVGQQEPHLLIPKTGPQTLVSEWRGDATREPVTTP